VHPVATTTADDPAGSILRHRMGWATAHRSFRSPDARPSRAGPPRRSQWSRGAHLEAGGHHVTNCPPAREPTGPEPTDPW